MLDLPISIAVVAFIAAASPLLSALVNKIIKVPLIVFEIVLGIVVGPALLGWVKPTDFIETLADFGLAMLFFMAGIEMNFKAINGRPLRRASLAWLISISGGVAAGLLIGPTIEAAIFIGIALATTSLGTLLPILRDAGESKTVLGLAIAAVGTVGEFGPLLAISLFLSGRDFGASAVFLLIFFLITALSLWLTNKGYHGHFHRLSASTLHTSAQFGVRLMLLIVAGAVALSTVFGLDLLLGAFASGILWRVFISSADQSDAAVVETKLDAVAFGFLIPVFFINTGITFDLDALLKNWFTMAMVPIFLILLLMVRGLPNLLVAPAGSPRLDRWSMVFFSATGLPLIVAIGVIGRDSGYLPASSATALVGAGMLSVLLFPALALFQRQRGRHAGTDQSPETV
ncbi:cation:proton antiporter [Arthrobacter sp.]|uniref:cation:proton antiporter n=1 Tax=Arthrobacter sp. TaxID=1667 RepID=UPI0026DF97EE|nr:cation:proton antiporter [Arthrobacter sp.]MDO5752156.1 cation:proton antiporter [Arthrobacter sp.]